MHDYQPRTWKHSSLAFTTPNVQQALLAADATRVFLRVQNLSGSVISMAFGSSMPTGSSASVGFRVPTNSSVGNWIEFRHCPTLLAQAVKFTAATSSTNIRVLEGLAE